MSTPREDASKPSSGKLAEPPNSLEAVQKVAWADANEAREAAEKDPESVGGFLRLPAGTPKREVARLAESTALAERLRREAGYAAVRVEHLREGLGGTRRDAKPLTLDDANEGGAIGPARPNILIVKSLNEWLDDASAQTVPLRLYGDLWFQNEVCVLFAETNVGKSILAVQIGQALASGNSTLFGFAVEAPPGKVLYIDFELSAQQFYGRYSDEQGRPFRFHPDLTRAVVDVDFDFDEGWAEAIDRSIEDLIKEHKPLYVIVDNITFLKDEQEKAKGAVPLMRRLKSLQRRYGVSLLALAHTPKRDQSRPLNKSDLGGSRHILNFVDSCFALGESHRDIGTRYVKQLKVRPVEFTLDTGNVAFLSLEKTDGFLSFNFEGFGPEMEHLRARSSAENTELSTEILTLKESDPHISNREIGRRLGTSHVQVGRVVKKEKEREAEEAAKGGTSVPLNGQGGTGGTDVPVFHPSKQNGNGTLPESGTGGTSVPGVPPHDNGSPETAGSDEATASQPVLVDDWDGESTADIEGDE